MASKGFSERIEKAAKFLATPTAQAARGYLAGPLETALTVLAVLSDGKPHDYEELAEATGLHHNTVRQAINALQRGGYPFTFTFSMVADTGRPQVSIQKKKRSKQT